MTSVQYRVMAGRAVHASDGPADAEVTLSIPKEVAAAAGFEADIEFMRGRLKVTGPTSGVLEALRSGEATDVLVKLASQP
jgi:hypothetical protein